MIKPTYVEVSEESKPVRGRQASYGNSQERTLREEHEVSFHHLLFTIAPKKKSILGPSPRQRDISSSTHRVNVRGQ